MKLIAITVAVLATLAVTATAHWVDTGSDACMRAFKQCNFRLKRNLHSVPKVYTSAPADMAITRRIVWKDSSKHIGIVNANREGRVILSSGQHVLLSKFHTGGQSFTPYQFKPFTIMRKRYGYKYLVATPYSGIGHEVFQGNEKAAKGKCIKVMITHYQTLNSAHPPTVTGNVNGAHDCIVFKTA